MTALVAGYGLYEVNRLPIDALPDITNKQVQINFVAPALGPEEVEKRVTFPIETALSGLAGVESTRSFSRNGYGQVTAIFDESRDLYFMRQQVSERLAQAKPNLPTGRRTANGAGLYGLGEIFMYSVEYAAPRERSASNAGRRARLPKRRILLDARRRSGLPDEWAAPCLSQDRTGLDLAASAPHDSWRCRYRFAGRI